MVDDLSDQGDERVRKRDRDEQDDRGRREDATDSTGVEREKLIRPSRSRSRISRPGDQEAGDDEEQVDADESPGQLGRRLRQQPGVEQDDERDGDPAQALDVGAEAFLSPEPRLLPDAPRPIAAFPKSPSQVLPAAVAERVRRNWFAASRDEPPGSDPGYLTVVRGRP
jgi:hypothetical protein